MPPRKTPDWFAVTGRLLLGVAAGVSLYLASMVLSRTALPGCEENSICQDALQSRWAYTFGIPVSFLGFLLYSYTIMLSWSFVRRDRSLSGLAGGMATSTIVAAALWFTALQVFDLEAVCFWCCLTHGSAVGGAFLLCHSRLRNPLPDLDCSVDLRDASSPLANDRVFRFTATGAALTGVGMLALGSLSGPLGPRRTAGQTPADRKVETVALLNGRFPVPRNFYPSFGSVAPGVRTAVLLNDYTSESCRNWIRQVEEAAANISPPVRVLVVPAWQSPAARDIQRTMLTVHHYRPSEWTALSAAIAAGGTPADADSVGKAAQSLIGKPQFAAAALASAAKIESQLQIAASVCTAATAGAQKDSLPLLVMDDRILRGPAPSREAILAFLKGEEPSSAPPPSAVPVLSVDEAVDLEDLPPGQSREIRITVRNTGEAALLLGKAQPEDGCEVVSMPQSPLAPGGTAAIGLRLTSPGQDGAFTRILRLPSNASGPPATIAVRGRTVSAMASASPSGTD